MFTSAHTGQSMTGARSRRRRAGRQTRIQGLKLESLEQRRLLAGDTGTDAGPGAGDPWPPDPRSGAVQGMKWEDLNGDGLRTRR